MRLAVRHIVTALLISGMLNLPAMAATEKPLGLVVQAQLAHLDSADAAIGTTVYAGDALDTQDGGTLRLKVGASQLYLLSSTAATFAQNSTTARLNVSHGIVGISSINPDQIELETPLGIVRAEKGSSAVGQVRIVGPQEMVVSAYRGNLIIDRDGEEHTVEAGKSYDVTLDLNADPAPANGKFVSAKKNHLALKVIIVVAEGVTAYLLWQEWSESCYNFKGC